jgi:hypothetical protein
MVKVCPLTEREQLFLSVMAHPVILSTTEAEARGLQVRNQPGIFSETCLKIKFSKGAEDIAQW